MDETASVPSSIYNILKTVSIYSGDIDGTYMRKRYFDPIAYNRVVVKGLKSKQELTTFRIAKMKEKAKPVQSVDQEEQENENRTEIQLKEGEDKEASTKDTQHTRTVEKKDSVKADSSSVSGSGSRKKEEVKIINEQVAKALAKQEAKTLKGRRSFSERRPGMSFITRNQKTARRTPLLNNLLKKVFEKKSEFNEKVLLVKDEKTEVLSKLDMLSQNLVDIQYLLEPADRKTVPTIPM